MSRPRTSHKRRKPRRFRRTSLLQSLESRQMLDGYGVRFEFADSSDLITSADSLQLGQAYEMRIFVQDDRPVESSTIPSGVRRAAFDVLLSQDVLQFDGPISIGPEFEQLPGFPVGEIQGSKLDNLSAVDFSQPSQSEASNEQLAFTIDVTTLATGSASLTVTDPNEANLFSQFHRPLTPVTEFSVTGNEITVLGGGVLLTGADNLSVTEGGNSDSFQVALTTQPNADVTLNLSFAVAGQANLSTNSLTFSSSNWNQPQTITLSAIDDQIAETPQTIAIQFANLQSTDPTYSDVSVSPVSLQVVDNDNAGLIVNPTFGLIVNEDGSTRTSQVQLASQPTGNVTVSVQSSDTGEITVSPGTLTFNANNWNTPQTITLTGISDDQLDGPQSVDIALSVLSSADPLYQALADVTVSAMNQDTDEARLLVAPNVGLITSENGASDTFDVRLSVRPNNNVVVNLETSDDGEGVLDQTQLTFTPSNWDQPQQVTVTGVADETIDGDIAYQVAVTVDASSDSNYVAAPSVSVMLTNQDTDAASLIVSQPTSDLVTETGGTTTFNVRLPNQPSGSVTVNVASNDTGEATVSPATLTFNSTNWNAPQTVTVIGVDDSSLDGDVNFQVSINSTSTSDPAYNGISATPISLTNQDDDVAGLIFSNEFDLQTDEEGGTDTFTVRLQSQPVGNVAIAVASSDIGEMTVSPNTLNFSPDNWDQPQSITLTGVDDNQVDGPQSVSISFDLSTSTDTAYAALSPPSLSATNQGDRAGLLIQPTAGLQTAEDGTSDTFDIRLTTQPTGNVVLRLVSTDPSEGTPTVNELTFTPANFDQLQTVTVVGQDDMTNDGDVAYQIEVTPTLDSDLDYRNLATRLVMLTNIDNDTPGLQVGNSSSPTTSEDGQVTSSISVRLNTQPTGPVTVTAIVSDPDEANVAPSTLFFTTSNWNVFQNLLISGVDDNADDGDTPFNVTLTTNSQTDSDYASGFTRSVSLTNIDDDQAQIIVDAATVLSVQESGTTATFTVALATAPEQPVTISATSTDTTEATVSPASLIFDASNFSVPQTFMVTGVDDQLADGVAALQVDLSVTTTDSAYEGLSITSVNVENRSDDEGGVLLLGANNLVVSENGSTRTFQVVLADPPSQPVTLPISTNDTDELEIDLSSITFTPQNWDQPQTVTVTGVADAIVDADKLATISIGPSQSQDPEFDNLDPLSVSVTNENIDTAMVNVTAMNTSEANLAVTYQIILSGNVESALTIDYATATPSQSAATPDVDYTTTAGTLNFSGQNAQSLTVEVPILADTIVEADEVLGLVLSNLDLGNSGIDPASLILPSGQTIASIINDDQATLTLSTANATVFEGADGESKTFTVLATLSAAVDGGLTVDAATSDGSATSGVDFTGVNQTLTFTGDANDEQSITITILGDDQAESDETLTVALNNLMASQSAITNAISVVGSPQTLTIANDDAPQLVLRELTSSTNETDSSSTRRFEVRLTDDVQDADGFRVSLSTVDATATVTDNDYVAVQQELTFAGTAGETKVVEVTINGDDIVEMDEFFQIRLGEVLGLDAGAELVIVTNTLDATITNDDQASLSLIASTNMVEEGDSGSTQVSFTVTLNGQVDRAFSVNAATVDQTAVSVGNADFNAVNSLLSFTGQNGETQTFSVEVLGDERLEATETFAAVLQSLSGLPESIASAISLPIEATIVQISADDTATLTLSDPQAISEGDGNTLSFSATLNGVVEGGFDLSFSTAAGSATADVDYQTNSGTLSFQGEGNETQTASVTTIADNIVESDETFMFQLGELSGIPNELISLISFESRSVTGTILNDDSAVIRLSGPSQTMEPGGPGTSQVLTYQVTLSAPVQGGVAVDYATIDGTATSVGGDFESNSGTIRFADGETQGQTVSVTVLGDGRLEAEESYSVSLSNLSEIDTVIASALSIGTPTIQTTILDDDEISVGFGQIASSATETGGTHLVDVRLSTLGGATLESPLVVNVQVGSQSSANSADFVLTTTQVVFPTGSTNGAIQQVAIDIINDGTFEPTEEISLSLSLADGTPAAIELEGSQHTVSIVDDPRDAVIRGRVWADTDLDGINETNELGIGLVKITLTGTSNQGEAINLETLTDASGHYQFSHLPAGTYRVSQEQPENYHDSHAKAGNIASGNFDSGAMVSSNAISQIVLPTSAQASGYDFAERGLKAAAIPMDAFYARPTTAARPSIQFSSSVNQSSRTSVLDAILANWNG